MASLEGILHAHSGQGVGGEEEEGDLSPPVVKLFGCIPVQTEPPNVKWRRHWAAVVFVAITYNLLSVPFLSVFDVPTASLYVFYTLDAISDLIFIADIVSHFVEGFFENEVLVLDPARIRSHYLRGWFWIDVLGALPLDLLFITSQDRKLHSRLRLPKALRALRASAYFTSWEHHTSHPRLVVLARVALIVFMTTHYVACAFWYVLTTFSTLDDVEWFQSEALLDGSVWIRYMRSFLWAFGLMSGTGADVGYPQKDSQFVLSFFAMLVGYLMLSIIVGQISSLITSTNESDAKYKRKVASLRTFMLARQLPKSIQDSVLAYYDYMYTRHGGHVIDDKELLASCPRHIQRRIRVYLHQRIVSDVPMFHGCSDAFLTHLVMNLEPETYLPGDNVVIAGEVGTSMFFVVSGSVNVHLEGGTQIATLGPGNVFGEIAVLLPRGRRTATVTAATYCDLYALDKSAVDEALENYSEDLGVLWDVAESRIHIHGIAQQRAARLAREKQDSSLDLNSLTLTAASAMSAAGAATSHLSSSSSSSSSDSAIDDPASKSPMAASSVSPVSLSSSPPSSSSSSSSTSSSSSPSSSPLPRPPTSPPPASTPTTAHESTGAPLLSTASTSSIPSMSLLKQKVQKVQKKLAATQALRSSKSLVAEQLSQARAARERMASSDAFMSSSRGLGLGSTLDLGVLLSSSPSSSSVEATAWLDSFCDLLTQHPVGDYLSQCSPSQLSTLHAALSSVSVATVSVLSQRST